MGLQKLPELKKHVAAIHCSNTLSLLQRKISNALLYHAYDELMVKDEHEITVKYLCSLIGYQGHNHSAIKNALKDLITTLVEWNLVDEKTNEQDWTASTMLASVRLKGPLCFYAYSPRMKALFYSPVMYGKVNLTIQAKFRSSYGLALYENCVRYKRLAYTRWFELDMFRRLMGVPDGQYLIFRDFKRRVLDKSIEEVNAYSELTVEPEILKQGREVIQIRFSIQEKSSVPVQMMVGDNRSLLTDLQLQLKEKLVHEFGISGHQAINIIENNTDEYIQTKIALVRSALENKNHKIINLAGYLLDAIKNDYKPILPEKTNAKRTHAVFKKSAQADYQREYVKYVSNKVLDIYLSLPTAEQNRLQAEFEIDYFYKKRLDLVHGETYRSKGFESMAIRSYFRDFLNLHYPTLIKNILTYDEYISCKK